MKLHKYFSLFALFLFSFSSYLQAAKFDYPQVYGFSIHKKPYAFTTYFEIESDHVPGGTLVKDFFSIHTCYDMYSHDGDYEGTGVCRLFSLGLLFSWATEIDVYDEEGTWIGMVDGQALTTAAARYTVYNGNGDRIAVAFVDYGGGGFTLVEPLNETRIIASFKRNFIPDGIDFWNITVFEGKEIDPLIIKTFAAFAVDRQSAFREDN